MLHLLNSIPPHSAKHDRLDWASQADRRHSLNLGMIFSWGLETKHHSKPVSALAFTRISVLPLPNGRRVTRIKTDPCYPAHEPPCGNEPHRAYKLNGTNAQTDYRVDNPRGLASLRLHPPQHSPDAFHAAIFMIGQFITTF